MPPLQTGKRGRQKRRIGHNLALRLQKDKERCLRFLTDPQTPFSNNGVCCRQHRVRENRTPGSTSGGEETWLRLRLRHRRRAKAAGNSYSLGPTAGRASPRLYPIAPSVSPRRWPVFAPDDSRSLDGLPTRRSRVRRRKTPRFPPNGGFRPDSARNGRNSADSAPKSGRFWGAASESRKYPCFQGSRQTFPQVVSFGRRLVSHEDGRRR